MLASYPHSRVTSSTAAIYGGNRRRGGAIAHRDAASSTGVAGSAGQVDAWAPLLRRLTPQVVAQAGRPHCHQKGPAAQEGVTTTSKRARRPTRVPADPRAHSWTSSARDRRTPSSTGQRAQSGARAHSARTTNSKGPASRLTPSSIPSTQCKSPDAFPFPDRSCKRFL